MTSQNKKNKGNNSYIYNGGHKPNGYRCKRLQFFTKQDRKRLNNEVLSELKGENNE